jgi:hypothetical protein
LFFPVALIFGLYFEPKAHAIPNAQEDCEVGVVGTTSNSFVLVPNSAVTVDNGTTGRNCIIQFSTEVFTSGNSATRLRYTIDSTNPASCIPIGPGDNFFSLPTGAFGSTRTAIGTTVLGPGSHTIRPCFNAVDFGEPGVEQSTFGPRCLVVECRTQ